MKQLHLGLYIWHPGDQILQKMEPTADHVFVPNDLMKNVFMAVSLDTYDDKEDYPGNLLPRYKQIVAERLTVAGLSIAYELNYPIEIEGEKLTVTYDKNLTYLANGISVFYYCTQLDACDAVIFLDMWTEIEMERDIGPARRKSAILVVLPMERDPCSCIQRSSSV